MVDLRGRAGGLVVLIAGAGACYVAPGCSSPFSGCEARRQCVSPSAGSGGEAGASDAESSAGNSSRPGDAAGARGESDVGDVSNGGSTAGVGGEAGAGGDAGAAPTAECVRDADCSDDLACDGVETCVEGICVAGTSPCANPEPAHCDAVCTELNGSASCVVRGQDQDHDGHFASNCATKPGDDCNDAAPTVYPGAPELCDQIDNDCDAKIDISDGLGAGGTTVEIGPAGATRPLARIAWATDRSVYGIAYEDISSSAAADLYFEEVNQAGAITRSPSAINDAASRTASNPTLSWAWGGTNFAAAWNTGSAVYLRTVATDGSELVGRMLAAAADVTAPALARRADGSGILIYRGAVSLDKNGSPAETAPSFAYGEGAVRISAALVGSQSVVSFDTYTRGPGNDNELFNADFSMAVSLPTAFSASIAARTDGFAMVGNTQSGGGGNWQFQGFKLNGSVQCGPVALPTDFVPGALTTTPTGYLAISSGSPLRAVEISPSCVLGLSFTIDPGPATDVRIASGAAGYGIVWQDTKTASPKRRLIGPHYCD